MSNELLTVWSDNPSTSLLIWGVFIIISCYLGRKQAHQVFKSTGQGLYSTLRLWGFSLRQLENRVSLRNREILLASGVKSSEKTIEREFTRVTDIVQRDLSQYPALHKQIAESISQIEIDYQNSSSAALLPPAWGNVVETIANLPANGDPTVNKLLTNIKKAVDESHQQTLKAFKKSSTESHRLLKGMLPVWRDIDGNLSEVDERISGLAERSKNIDEQIENYSNILSNQDIAINALGSSALTQLFISGLVLVIAVLGGLINFQLIAMPMAEMVGGASYIGSLKTSDIAALVIILIEIAMGLFLLESLRITNLFPIISSMDDKMRRRMMWVTFTILVILASIESSLAYMRDLLALDREALQQSLIGVGASSGVIDAQFRWIPSVGQMVMGFILPFALAFIAIPLESFIHSLRIVMGLISISILRVLRIMIRISGGVSKHVFNMLTHLFDLIIMLPLSIEKLIKSQLNSNQKQNSDSKAEGAKS
ncbi:MAG: hypothetical protein ACJAS9_001833 [Polaribacter sp.]|jgi:hypothetical protein